jgi:NAD-dependent SIR2 family protein deacetylase
MAYPEINLDLQTAILKTTLNKADLTIIGAGSGLSTATGLLYDDFDTFNTWFPGYYEHYDLRSINEVAFYQFPTPEEQYAWWARFISAIRYRYPPGKPYLNLHRIIKNKNYSVIITMDKQ